MLWTPPTPGRRSALCSALLCGVAALAWTAEARARVRWNTPGAYRTRIVGIGEYPLDRAGTDSGQRFYGRHRLRIDPDLEAGPATFHIQLDVLSGQIFGDTTAIGARFVERRHGDPQWEFDGWTTVEPRMIWAEWRGELVTLQVGQMGSDWGLGLLASDGQDRPTEEAAWVERFGDRWNGDLVDRVLLAITPLSRLSHGILGDVVVAAGAEYVYQDEQASFLDDDSASQLLASVYFPGEELRTGAYVVHRRQDDRDGDRLESTAYDLYLDWLRPLYTLNADLRIRGEAMLRLGETDRLRPLASPDGVDMIQLGWVGRAEMSWHCPRLAIGIESGYASGDADPDDGELRELTFDPDYRVGFILFSDVLRLVSLRAAERAADPNRVGEPPAGVDLLPTDGAVRNTLYVLPGVTWRPGRWRLTSAYLFAWAAEPFIDPTASFEAGGAPRNHRGRPAGRFYGHEVDGSVHYQVPLPAFGTAEIGLQAGVLLPGVALDGPGQTAPFANAIVSKVVGRLDLRW